jgi:hypothetical protein
MGTQEPPDLGGGPAESDGARKRREAEAASEDADAARKSGPRRRPEAAPEVVGSIPWADPTAPGTIYQSDGSQPYSTDYEPSREEEASPAMASPAAALPARPNRLSDHGDETLHARNLPPDEPAARFDQREKPSRYAPGVGQRQPTKPLDPIRPYMPPPVARRRRSDWSVMIFVMVVASAVMVGCCIAGYALYTVYGIPWAK